MQVINLTEHTITDLLTGKVYEKSGKLFRTTTIPKPQSGYGDMQVNLYEPALYGGTKLPPVLPNTVYIVSNMALNAIPKNRKDFIAPGPVTKDKRTRLPIGCIGFQVNN
jgi:hypothetical protein